MKQLRLATPVQMALMKLNLRGDIIPHSWIQFITIETEKGRVKPDWLGIFLLARVCSIYQPVESKSGSGQTKAYLRRFAAERWRPNIAELARIYFGSDDLNSKRQIKLAFARLVKKNLVSRQLVTARVGSTTLSNVLEIEPIVEVIDSITFNLRDENPSGVIETTSENVDSIRGESYKNLSGVVQKNVRQSYKNLYDVLRNTPGTPTNSNAALCARVESGKGKKKKDAVEHMMERSAKAKSEGWRAFLADVEMTDDQRKLCAYIAMELGTPYVTVEGTLTDEDIGSTGKNKQQKNFARRQWLNVSNLYRIGRWTTFSDVDLKMISACIREHVEAGMSFSTPASIQSRLTAKIRAERVSANGYDDTDEEEAGY